MKRCKLLLLLVAVGSAGFYDLNQINEIRIYFDQPNWDEILDSLYAAGEEGRLVGTAVINGRQFDSVGVRYKGKSSYNPARRKNPFNIKLDYIIPGQTIEGHGTLRLANVYKDPSFVREVLSYEIARNYMPAGRANFANIYVNDTLIGLYTNCEDVDKLLIRAHFYCDENARFKGQMKDSVPMIVWKYLGPESTPYLDYFELESDSGWDELIDFLDTLNNYNGYTEQVLNVDQHLWMLAFDILMVNLDAPINMPQNFYLYRDASARFNPIIWDLNENFGAFRDLVGTGQLSLTQMQQLNPFLRLNDPDYPIVSKVLSCPRYRRMFVAHMKTMIADWFASSHYQERAEEIQGLIDEYVRADPNKFYTYNDFLNNITRSVGSGPLAIVGLTELMNPRVSFLLSQPDFQATAPVIDDVTCSTPQPAPNSQVSFSARVSGADSVFLNYRQNPGRRFCRTPMFDDGEHNDGAAGDGVYGATVRLGAGEFHYYVYAENSAAGIFYPERAEHEFLILPVCSAVVINELMADNVRTVQDPNGEYDDWIEFYNNSSLPVNLDNYLLSDDSLNFAKWSFPDIEIPAHGFLVVWADNDLTQPGLHCNFQLNRSGEQLIFSDPDGRQLDRVIFGPQGADISFGRYPNGIGRFILMDPTFLSQNVSGIGTNEQTPTASGRFFEGAFPNPFSRATVLRYSLPSAGEVELKIFDVSGRQVMEVRPALMPAGVHTVKFFAPDRIRTQGVYFAHLRVRLGQNQVVSDNLKLILTR